MYKISKEFHFSAAHQLHGLPEDHPCSRLHGHNYVIIVHLKSRKLDKVGFVKDYNELKSIKDFIDDNLDHRNLNDLLGFNTTAENIAKWFYDIWKPTFPHIYKITVKETPKTEAIYEED